LGGTLRITEAALRSESSRYFLVAPNVAISDEWRRAPEGEAAGVCHCATVVPPITIRPVLDLLSDSLKFLPHFDVKLVD
jgi:hypothetical protein